MRVCIIIQKNWSVSNELKNWDKDNATKGPILDGKINMSKKGQVAIYGA